MIETLVGLPATLEEGILVWEPDGAIVYANVVAERIIGVPPGALNGVTADNASVLGPDGDPLPPEQTPAARVVRTGGRVDAEIGVPHADGGTVWLSIRAAPLEDGTICGAFSVIGQAEAKARAAARVSTMVDDTPDLVLMFDGQGAIEYVSPSVCRALSLRQDELLGRLWRAITHLDDVPTMRAALSAASPENPHTELLEVRLRTGDGSFRWIEGQAILRYRGGLPISIELTGRDVTRVRAAEDMGRRLQGRLEGLVAGAPDGILMIDEDNRIAVINEQACSLMELDMTPDEVLGHTPRVLFPSLRRQLVEPETAIARMTEIAAAGKPARFVFFECNDGRRVSFDFAPLKDGGRLWLFRDVTQFKLIEEEQRGFLATMSHEIKTPLSGIAGAAELLRETALGPREQELAEVIDDAAQSLTALLRDVLDVSRAEAGRAETEAVDYDPRRLLTSIAGVLRPSLRGRPIELRVTVDPAVPDALRGDAARVRQIVLNLASNAVKYTQEGIALIDAGVAGDKLCITVSDTGRGIAEEDIANLFEPWTRNHGRAWAGTGLGLSIARRLARAMGGDVTVVSALGDGSAFTLELPLQPGEATPEMGFAAAPALVAGRVLVAEDDDALRRLIGMQLERLGVAPTLVEHGQAAVDAVRRDNFDAVLLDLRMPVMGGLDAARAIRTLDSGVPILALTADTAAEDVAHCRDAGMDGHLAKPVSLPALRAELDRRITPVLDDSLLDELADSLGGRALVDQMLAVYQGELAGRLERLQAAADPAALRDAAHALRSPSASFGIARLAARLGRIETAARAGQMADRTCALEAAAQADAALRQRLA